MSKRSVLRTLIVGALALTVLMPATAAQAAPTLAEIEAQLDKTAGELEDTVEAYNKITEDLEKAQAANAELQKQIQPLADNVAAATANVDVIAVAAFKSSGRLANLSVVLGAQSSDTLMDQLTTLRQINKVQQAELAGYTEAKTKLDDEQKKINETLAAENAKKAEIETKKKKIEGDVKKLEDLKRRATAAGSTKTTQVAKPSGPPPAVSGKAGQAVSYAWNQLGKPYKFGAAGPGSFDCSGLTLASWKSAGISLPRTARDQYYATTRITRAQLQPGDLVFYRNLGHVGIYIGNNRIIHAPNSRSVVSNVPVEHGNSLYGYGRVKG